MADQTSTLPRFPSRTIRFSQVVRVPGDIWGMARILGNLAKPRCPAAPIKVIVNWHCVLTGQPVLFGHRSRSQVINSSVHLMRQLEAAWTVSEWATGYLLQSSLPADMRPDLAANIVDFVKGRVAGDASLEAAVDTHWKPYAPIMHLLTAWRQEMYRSRRGLIFDPKAPDPAARMARFAEMLAGDPGWAIATAEASSAHLAAIAMNVRQMPRVRLFSVAA